MSECMNPRCHLMREHDSDECGWPAEKTGVQPPATPQGPTGSPVGYMESLMTRRKAVKLLEALAESCDRPDGEDHDWHECRSCVAAFSLTQPGAKALLRSLLAELTRASTPSPEGQTTWQPIETAPVGIKVWVGGGNCPKVHVNELVDFGRHGKAFSGLGDAQQPTHWMPYVLPSPPTPEGTQP